MYRMVFVYPYLPPKYAKTTVGRINKFITAEATLNPRVHRNVNDFATLLQAAMLGFWANVI
jgi:hypothetical protein